MNNKMKLSLLDDTLFGHLFCVYAKIVVPVNGIYYIVLNLGEETSRRIPDFLKSMGIFYHKITLGVNIVTVIESRQESIEVISKKMEATLDSSSFTYSNQLLLSVKKLKKLLKKYKVNETPVLPSDLKWIRDDSDIYNTLTIVISIDPDQYKKLCIFLEKYIQLYLEKELEGQENYSLPENYLADILDKINNPAFIQIFGRKNITINNNRDKSFFYCHSVMVLYQQQQIRIRKMIIVNQAVILNIDNLTPDLSPEPQKPFCKFENNTFKITLKNDTEALIAFEEQRDTNQILDVFKILYDHWSKLGQQTLETVEIELRLIKKGYSHEIVTKPIFLQTAISNIRKKIKGMKLDKIMTIEFDEDLEGYQLHIKNPQLQ